MKLSIVTPSYNQGRFIDRTIQSVLSQRPKKDQFEYVVFDGGSNDETTDILQKYDGSLSWVSQKDKGQTDAVNKGIRATDGEIIGWLNSDDIYYPSAIENVLDYFKRNPDVDVFYGNAYHIDAEDKIIEEYPTEDFSFDRLVQTCFICQPATFFRRSVVKNYGLLDERLNYCMDYEFWLRLARSGARFQRVPLFIAGSRLYPETKTLGSAEKAHREINKMFKRDFGYVPDRWISNYAHVRTGEFVELDAQPKKFFFYLIMITLVGSLYWNRSVSEETRSWIQQWWRMVRA